MLINNFQPCDEEELLALKIAVQFFDEKSLAFYIRVTRALGCKKTSEIYFKVKQARNVRNLSAYFTRCMLNSIKSKKQKQAVINIL